MERLKFLLPLFLLILNITISNDLLAQEKPERSFEGIELPEFIIIGVEKVEIPKASKGKAELLPILSSDFIQPTFSEEDLPTFNLAMREEYSKINLAQNINSLKGSAEIGGGTVTLPYGRALLAQNPENFFFRLGAFGESQREYKKKAGLNSSGIELRTSYFSKNESKFLPSSKYDFGILYTQNSYHLFLKNPIPSRKLTFGDGYFVYENNYFNNFKGNFKLQSSSVYLKQNDYIESVLSFSTNLNYISHFANFFLFVDLKKLSYKNNLTTENDYNYSHLSGGTEAYITRDLRVGAGLSINNIDYDNYFAPYGQLSFKFHENFSLYAEFNPTAILLTQRELFARNRYAELDSTHDNFLFKKNGNIKAAIKYETRKNYSFSGGASFFTTKKFPYYRYVGLDSSFRLSTIEAKCLELFLTGFYQSDYFGYLSTELFIRSYRDKKGYFIPGVSSLSFSISYAYFFGFGLSTLIGMDYSSQQYANVAETYRIPQFFNLYAQINYKLLGNLWVFAKGNNLLNQKKYYAYKYIDPPIDVILGLNYRWE